MISQLKKHESPIECVIVDDNAGMILSLSLKDHMICVWDIGTFALMRTVSNVEEWSRYIMFFFYFYGVWLFG
jgi:WD40 repeat protein